MTPNPCKAHKNPSFKPFFWMHYWVTVYLTMPTNVLQTKASYDCGQRCANCIIADLRYQKFSASLCQPHFHKQIKQPPKQRNAWMLSKMRRYLVTRQLYPQRRKHSCSTGKLKTSKEQMKPDFQIMKITMNFKRQQTKPLLVSQDNIYNSLWFPTKPVILKQLLHATIQGLIWV